MVRYYINTSLIVVNVLSLIIIFTNVLFVSEDNLVVLEKVCVGVGPPNVENNLRVCWLLSVRDVGGVTVASGVADLLRNVLADSHWNFLVFLGALLAGNILALLQGLVGAHLVRDLDTVLSGNVDTLLLRDIVTHGVGNLLLLGLRHVLALVVGVLLAGPGDFSPDLVVAVSLPLELAVLPVLCGALSLGVRFVLSLVLLNTHTLVHSGAALLIDGLTLLPGGGLAQSLVHGVANLLIVGDALLGLLLLVLRVPHHAVLRPAGHGLALRLRGSRHQT